MPSDDQYMEWAKALHLDCMANNGGHNPGPRSGSCVRCGLSSVTLALCKKMFGVTAPQSFGPIRQDPITLPCMPAAKPLILPTSAPAAPVYCKSCNVKNDYASPNQPDGSYICYECR